MKKKDKQRFIQLPPRLLQAGKLNFQFVNGLSGNVITNLNTENPIAGWVMPNNMERSLAIYTPGGTYLGDIYVSNNTVVWQVTHTQQSAYAHISDITTAYPPLGNFMDKLTSQDNTAFDAFFDSIDESLWSTNPLGERKNQNLSIFMGRPLALVKAKLQLILKEKPLTDPSFKHTFDPKTSTLPGYTFTVRLGDLATRDDGLIGYFLNDHYSIFYSPVPSSEVTSSYVKAIGAGNILLQFQATSDAYVTMLLDPRGKVHATTGILPTKEMEIPNHYVEKAIKGMEANFRVDPLLTKIVSSEYDHQTVQKIEMPVPSYKKDNWEWQENESGTWKKIVPNPTNGDAKMGQHSELRAGKLKIKHSN